jgi:ABC-type transport system involved in cytochrome bd biosynthesis fused ATPase/permease subunit
VLVRVGAAVVVMEIVAVVLAWLEFGWPVLVVGAPLLLGTVILFVAFRITQPARRALRARRADRFAGVAPTGGLMSGFFEPVRR